MRCRSSHFYFTMHSHDADSTDCYCYISAKSVGRFLHFYRMGRFSHMTIPKRMPRIDKDKTGANFAALLNCRGETEGHL